MKNVRTYGLLICVAVTVFLNACGSDSESGNAIDTSDSSEAIESGASDTGDTFDGGVALPFDMSALDPADEIAMDPACLLYTSPSPRDRTRSRMPSSA